MIGKYINFNGFCRNLGLGMIPTEYRDSMSYYENLVWLCNFLEKEVIPNMDELTKGVNDLNEAFIQLKEWCENYFESEDFTALVNARLDEMVEDGTFESLLETVVDARIEDFSQEFDETVDDLEEQMSDLSTEVNGYDDRITAVEGSVDTLTTTTIPGLEDTVGTLSGSVETLGGTVEDNSNDIKYINNTRNLKQEKMKIVAHRGASLESPENTTVAFSIAGEHGFWGCETDISESVDGVFYCMHDASVDRTTDGTGNVADLSSYYIDSLTIDGGNRVGDYPGLRVPRLEEYLQICNNYGMVPVIELKDDVPDLDKFYEVLYNNNMHRKALIVSFLGAKLTGILAIDKNLKTMYLQNEVNDTNIAFCKQNGISGLYVLYTALNQTNIEQLHSEGLEVGAWTVDSGSTNHTFKSYFLDYSTMNSLDYEAVVTDLPIRTVNKLPLYTEKDLRKAEGGQFLGGVLGGLIKRARLGDVTDISSCYAPNTTKRVISTMILPIKYGSTVTYTCDSASKFGIQAFDKTGNALSDLGWIVEGSGTGTFTESRTNTAFGIAVFARNDTGNINEKDLDRFSKIINSVTI